MKKLLLIAILIAGSSIFGHAQTSSCEADLQTANQRLSKALDAYEKAIAVIEFKDQEIAARKQLDALKDELLKAKDQMIADVMASNDFLRKDRAGKTKSKLRRFFETAERVLLVAAGVYLGRH